jgi:hypothetical protein
MKNKTKIGIGIGALALIGYLYYRKSIQRIKIQETFEQPQVGVSQGEPISDKASLFNLFTRTRYTNPTNTPKPRPQTLTQEQIWQLNQSKGSNRFAPISQTPSSVTGNKTGDGQQQINVNKVQ